MGFRRAAWRGVGLVACACVEAGDRASVEEEADQSCVGGSEIALVVRSIRFVRAEGGVSDGFNLDGEVTEPGDPTGCGVPDFVSPDGEPGIDNSFARLLPILDLTEASAAEEVIATAIQSGDVLLMVRISGIDDWRDDDCVIVEVFQGVGDPLLLTDGRLAPGQTFEIDVEGGRTEVLGSLTGGVLEARGADIHLPLQVLNAVFDLAIMDAAIRLSVDPEGHARGILGGGLDVAELLGSLTSQGVADEVLELVSPVLEGARDLAPDEDGVCTRMSTTIAVEAVETFLMGEVSDEE